MPRLYAYLRARCACQEEAADLTQQVYLKALQAWDRRPEKQEGWVPWLFRIAQNAAIDAHRRRHAALDWDLLPEAMQPAAHALPEAAVVRDETLRAVRDLVAALPIAKRELLALRFAAELSYREIAALQGRREAAVKKEMSRILRQLRERHDHQ